MTADSAALADLFARSGALGLAIDVVLWTAITTATAICGRFDIGWQIRRLWRCLTW